MRLSKAEIAIYSAIVGGTYVALSNGLPAWLILTAALVLGVPAFILLKRRALRTSDLPQVNPSVSIGQDMARRQQRADFRQAGFALAISLGFCVLAVFLWDENWRVALVTLTFFGSGVLVFVAYFLRKWRERRFRATQVGITGSIDIPMSRARFAALAFGFMAVGSIIAWLAVDYPGIMRVLGVFVAFCGLALLVALVTGFAARQSIRFEPAGIVFRQRKFSYFVPWGDIRGIDAFEYAHNPFVRLWLADPSRIEVTPAEHGRAFLKQVRRNRGYWDADLVIEPRSFGFDVPPFLAALSRYISEPEAREELAPVPETQKRLSGPSS